MTGGAKPGEKAAAGLSASLKAAQVTELQDKIREAVSDLPAQQADLRYAKQSFAPNFDRNAWRAAFDGTDPADRAKVNAVNWPTVTLVNHLNTVIINASVLAGFRNWDQRKTDAPGHYHALKKAGLISEATRRNLDRANAIRVSMTHMYATATADDVHELVSMLDTLAPRVMADLASWLQSMGI
jgi:hypothetical protein